MSSVDRGYSKPEPGDEGDASPLAVIDPAAQDEAFIKAMRRAIKRGSEHVKEGVKTVAPGEASYARRIYGETRVLTCSVAATLG